ncbi:hypothetical protein CBS101457_000936 [Exobasidium rhododendri]|nr:hypothetical protein CBS101457_000936 [Exobasidium rhododendri]
MSDADRWAETREGREQTPVPTSSSSRLIEMPLASQREALHAVNDALKTVEDIKVKVTSTVGDLIYLKAQLERLSDQLTLAPLPKQQSPSTLPLPAVGDHTVANATRSHSKRRFNVKQPTKTQHLSKKSTNTGSKKSVAHPNPSANSLSQSSKNGKIDQLTLSMRSFVGVLLDLQHSSKRRGVHMGMIASGMQRVDPEALLRVGVKKFSQLVVVMQEHLDLVIEVGPKKGDETIRFREIERPWLIRRRVGVPSFKEQIERLWKEADAQSSSAMLDCSVITTSTPRLKEQVPAAAELFDPLIEALVRHHELGGIPFSALQAYLPQLDDRVFLQCHCDSVCDYMTMAEELCNIEIETSGQAYDPIARLADPQRPFKEEGHNVSYLERMSAHRLLDDN